MVDIRDEEENGYPKSRNFNQIFVPNINFNRDVDRVYSWAVDLG